jgi:hypothetical protein
VATFISVSLSSEWALRLAEPMVSQQPPGAGVGAGEHRQLALGVVLAVVGLGGQHDDDPELVAGRPAQLVRQQVGDLGRPQELVLEVHVTPCAAQRADVALQDAEVSLGNPFVHVLRDSADHLDGVLAAGRRRGTARQRLAGELLPAHREVVAHVRHSRTA